jgi:hypothetical protein
VQHVYAILPHKALFMKHTMQTNNVLLLLLLLLLDVSPA